MSAQTKPASLPTEDAWADMSDDADAEEAPTVRVDSLDLTALSIGDKNEGKSTTSTGRPFPFLKESPDINVSGRTKAAGEVSCRSDFDGC